MCSRCDELVTLIESTRDRKSWVEWNFPNGTPRLMTRGEDNEVQEKALPEAWDAAE